MKCGILLNESSKQDFTGQMIIIRGGATGSGTAVDAAWGVSGNAF